VAYVAKVRISVRARDTVVVREGSGSGEARAFSPGQAHELALKSAETDATKRALTSFGNVFGLALYDKEQAGVGKGRPTCGTECKGPWLLRSHAGKPRASFDTPQSFAEALRRALRESISIEALYCVWQQNVATVRELHRLRSGPNRVDGIQLVAYLKTCARDLTAAASKRATTEAATNLPAEPSKIDKSVLTLSEPKRIRSKEHLRFVAQQPCLICGRTPSQAHHIRHTQARGVALKVSDEFTVPLCAIHHSQNHTTGD